MIKIMLVDDEEFVLTALKRAFARENWEIEYYTDQLAALDRAYEEKFAVVVSDFRMPGLDGVDFLTEFSRRQPETTRIILSGQADRDGLMAAINNARIFRFVEKPWDDEALKILVHEAVEVHLNMIEEKGLADEARLSKGTASEEEVELRKLERESPGITQVDRDLDGSIILDDSD